VTIYYTFGDQNDSLANKLIKMNELLHFINIIYSNKEDWRGDENGRNENTNKYVMMFFLLFN